MTLESEAIVLKPLPVRRGRPVCLTLDADAEGILRTLRPNTKCFGYFVSELLRKELRERATREKTLQAVREAFGEGKV